MDADVITSAVGITIIINLSYALSGFRKLLSKSKVLGKFIKCPMCVGFWIGGLSVLNTKDIQLIIQTAATVSLISYTWYLLMRYFIDKYD